MINKCLFPAAGYGPRFLPAAKAMLPIVNKRLIEYAIEKASTAGMKKTARDDQSWVWWSLLSMPC